MKTIEELRTAIHDKSTEQQVAYFQSVFGESLKLASSTGAEDQVLTHMLLKANPSAKVFVLDTGRLNPETYDVMAETETKYNFNYEYYFPNSGQVQDMVRQKGINLFYESIENRKACCGVRKVEPLNRALSDASAWITGLRKEQSVTRTDLEVVEQDNGHNNIKLNPLADWSTDDIWTYIKENNIPYNALHDKGYPSIGCAPCTRAIKDGEDIRAGRWWWESPESKECGLHIVDGKIVPGGNS